MAESKKGLTSKTTQVQFVEPRKVKTSPGWKYKSSKLGPVSLPWYASPESQLILVSFVCFLCPGKAVQHCNIVYFFRPVSTDYVKACSMLSMALVVQGSSNPMPVTPQTPRSTLLSLLSVSSPAQSPTPSALELLSPLVVSDTVSTSAHIYATIILRTSGMLSSPGWSIYIIELNMPSVQCSELNKPLVSRILYSSYTDYVTFLI